MSYLRPILAVAVLVTVLSIVVPMTTSADNGLEARVDQLTSRVVALEAELKTMRTRLQSAHPDAGMEKLASTELQAINTMIARGNMAGAKPLLDDFMANYGNTRAGKQARSMQKEVSVVGKSAPGKWGIDYWYQGENDIDLDASGPTVLVFWETWCPHCRREVPKLQKLYEKNRDRGLQVIGLSKLTKGASDESVKKFIADNNLQFPLAKEDGSLATHFGVAGIPAAAVVMDNKVVWRGHPARLSLQMIDSWLQ